MRNAIYDPDELLVTDGSNSGILTSIENAEPIVVTIPKGEVYPHLQLFAKDSGRKVKKYTGAAGEEYVGVYINTYNPDGLDLTTDTTDKDFDIYTKIDLVAEYVKKANPLYAPNMQDVDRYRISSPSAETYITKLNAVFV